MDSGLPSFRLEVKKAVNERLRLSCYLGIVLVPLFGFVDFVVVPEKAALFFVIRLVVSAGLAGVLWLTFTQKGKEYPEILGFVAFVFVGFSIAIMIRNFGGYSSSYYAGLNLILLAMAVLMPWRTHEALGAGLTIYGSYLLPSLAFDDITDPSIFIHNNFFLLSTLIITVTATFVSNRLRFLEFKSRYQLTRSNLQVERSKKQLEVSYEKLKELDAVKTQFFSNVSHELRTPLTLILAPLESLYKGEFGKISADQKKHVEVMHQNALRLLKMINNLLELSRMDSGKVGLNLEEADLGGFIERIVSSVQPMAEKKKITLSFEKEDAVYSLVFDKEKIERVLLNLVFNSLKFTDSGGQVSVRLGFKNRIDEGMNKRDLLIRVKDNGMGIPQESHAAVFERFSQVDASSSRKHEGTGIGLALARELVELHGGQIGLESEPGKGTSMEVTIPSDLQVPSEAMEAGEEVSQRRKLRDRRREERRDEEDWTKTLHVEAEYSEGKFLSPVAAEAFDPKPVNPALPTVLLVEDNTDMRNFIAYQLEKEFNLLQASDGLEGFKIALEKVPEVIITDVMMPGKDGYELCREVKSNPRTRHISVVILTAKAGLKEKIAALELGADDFLAKPFNSQELKAKIRSLVQFRKLEREVYSRNQELEKVLSELRETQSQLVHSEKMASLGLLVAGIAHEVNNPVSFAKGSLSNLRRYYGRLRESLVENREKPELPPASLKILKDMEASMNIIQIGLERTEGIVTDLKTFARKDEKNFKRVNLEEGLKATVKLLRMDLGRRIEFHADYGISGEVEVIPGQINQVFMNLLQNAIYAIPHEGVIRVTTREEEDRVRISIQDNGSGIRAEDLDRVFEPFYTTKPVGKGTGLGLSVSYRIIKNHGGYISVSSRPGEGTEFIITLPKVHQQALEPVTVKGGPR